MVTPDKTKVNLTVERKSESPKKTATLRFLNEMGICLVKKKVGDKIVFIF